MSAMKAILAATLLLVCASAARMPGDIHALLDELPKSVYQPVANKPATSESIETSAFGVHNDLEGLLLSVDVTKREHYPIHITARHYVRPDLHGNFIRKWQDYSSRTRKDKGVLLNSLNKVSGDNIVFSSYTVFKDIEGGFDHLRSDALREFGGFIQSSDIVVQYNLLFHIGGSYRSNGAYETDISEAADDNKGKHREYPLRLITKFVVPPGELEHFVKEWRKLEDDLSEAKGNQALDLYKPADDNVVLISYSAWRSHRDFFEAARKKASIKFVEYLADEDIAAVTKKLYEIPNRRD